MTPDRIGRYRIVRLIGTGGMGSVYEGRDDELQRSVAIKGLRIGRDDAERRERLRREAMSAGSLSHPAVTRIYEVVRDDDADWVVMEFVPGRPLDEALAQGPLPGDDVARIGVEVAEALAEAHAAGIVHRDIKAENVMLLPSGHVKLLDFGFAKWIGVRSGDAALSGEGLVVGTARAMSPEQAFGHEVDGRSDLFSLGSLLFELAAGRPAFSGGTPMEVMVRITRGERDPVTVAAPGIRPDLAQVIERCLEVKPEDRFQTAVEVAASLARITRDFTLATEQVSLARTLGRPRQLRAWALASAGIVLVAAAGVLAAYRLGWLEMRRPLAVAVLPPEVTAPGDAGRLASAAVTDAVAAQLARVEGLTVLAGREVRGVETRNRRTAEIARELGVEELVETTVSQDRPGDPLKVSLARTDGRTGQVVWSHQFEVDRPDLLLVQDRIALALHDGFEGFPLRPEDLRTEVSGLAYGKYLEVRSRFEAGRRSRGFAEEQALLEEAVADSPRFAVAIGYLADICISRYRSTGRAEDLGCARDRLARLKVLAPDLPLTHDVEVRVLLAEERRDEAAAVAERWTRERPGDFRGWRALGQALRQLNRFAEAERALTRSVALLPGSDSYLDLAQLHQSQGDYQRARVAAREVLSRTPNDPANISVVAEIEMYAGNSAEAERLYRLTAKLRDDDIDHLHLGFCLYYLGRIAEAADEFRTVLARRPASFLAAANLADCEFALGARQAAAEHYRTALALTEEGYRAGSRDRSLLETRARALAQLGRGPEAVEVIQKALAEHPDNPSTMFMAALVAAVLDEHSSCITWTAKSRARNAPAVWFTGPEFAHVANDPAFARLLR